MVDRFLKSTLKLQLDGKLQLQSLENEISELTLSAIISNQMKSMHNSSTNDLKHENDADSLSAASTISKTESIRDIDDETINGFDDKSANGNTGNDITTSIYHMGNFVNTDINIHSIGESLDTTTLITDMDKEAITESKREEETIKRQRKLRRGRRNK